MIELKISGHYAFRVRKADTHELVREGKFDNLILNTGLDRLMSGSTASLSYLVLGTGTTAPAVTDTWMTSPISTSSVQSTSSDVYTAGPPAYFSATRTWRFATGAAAGTWSEIGVGWTASSGNLFSRALILDGVGSPTTLTILPDEYLDVDYTIRSYPQTGDVTGSVTLTGSTGGTHSFTARPSLNSNSSYWGASALIYGLSFGTSSGSVGGGHCTGAILAADATPVGCSSIGVTRASGAYTIGTYIRTITLTFGITSTPSGGVMNSVAIAGWGPSSNWAAFQIGFTPGIAKTNANIVTLTFQFSIGRYTP